MADAATQEAATDETATQQSASDDLRLSMLDLLQGELGDKVLGHELVPGDDLCVRVDRSVWRRTVELCRDRLGCKYFCFLSGIDWQPNPDLLGEKAWEPEEAEEIVDDGSSGDDPDAAAPDPGTPAAAGNGLPFPTGVAGGNTRFQVFARLYNLTTKVGITLKADLDADLPRVDSLVPLYRGADWHEREAWEMYGFDFTGHPGLRHLYLPSEFEGYPLRKDFPLLARIVKPWPGLVNVEPMPGEEVEEVALPSDEG